MTILAAIDENKRSNQVIEIAYDLAIQYDDTVVALHVIPIEDYETHRESVQEIPGFQNFSLDQEIDSAKRFARKFADEALDGADMSRIEARGRVGDVTEEILSEVQQVDPRYLVISGRRRSPTGKALFGNTAQELLLKTDCPVVSQLSNQ